MAETLIITLSVPLDVITSTDATASDIAQDLVSFITPQNSSVVFGNTQYHVRVESDATLLTAEWAPEADQ